MAKTPKKVAAGEEEAAPKGGGRKKLVLIAAAVLLAAGGGGGFFLMKGRAAQAEAHAEPAPETKKPIVFLDLREMVLNLGGDAPADKGRFAKVRLALELKDAKVETEVKPLMPRVEDALQVYMRELRPADLAGSVGLYRLREELLRRVNVAVYPARVEAVLFKDVIVQ